MLTFWIAAFGIPLIAVIGNSLLRFFNKMPQSATADLVLFLVVFNAVAIIQHKDFQPHVLDKGIRPHFVAIYVALLIVNLFFWIVAVFVLEKGLLEKYDHGRKRYSDNPFLYIFASYMVATLSMCSSMAVFLYGT